jgi:hypothetical protein
VRQLHRSRRRLTMEYVWVAVVVAAYVVLMRWVLPRLGVPT